MTRLTAILIPMVSAAMSTAVQAAELQSVSRLAFDPSGTLYAADWKAAQVDALTLPAAPAPSGASFNLVDLDRRLAAALGTADYRLEGFAMRPGTDQAYIALSAGPERKPAIVIATPDGVVRSLDIGGVEARSAALEKPPTGDDKFWQRTPLRSFTVTDLKWHDGKLYVAGLSNGAAASTLRILPTPFDGKQSMLSVAMYHTTHNQIETRAPIRLMTFETLDGQDTMIAAYLCSPIVTIPVSALEDGAHVEGKTIAELGYGDVANSMVSFSFGPPGKAAPALLLVNDQRDADVLPVAEIAAANREPGLTQQVPFGAVAGAAAGHLPYGGVLALDNQSDALFAAVRRDRATGHLQLVSYDKGVNIRISDYVSEYDFPDYRYQAPFQVKYLKPVIEKLTQEEGFPLPGTP